MGLISRDTIPLPPALRHPLTPALSRRPLPPALRRQLYSVTMTMMTVFPPYHLQCLTLVVNPIPIPDSPKSSTPLKKFSIIPKDEKATLENGGWLSDVHIRAAQSLLQRQFPEQNGSQSPVVLASKLQWKSDPSDFIQIINVSGQHWLKSRRGPQNHVNMGTLGCPYLRGVHIFMTTVLLKPPSLF